MTLLLGSLQLGLLYGILGLGIYISFRILSTPDLTTEGSFAFGLAVSAAVTAAGHPILALPAALAAGALAGCVTGFLQTKLRIHPILAGIITMSGLYSVNLLVLGGASNLSLVRTDTIFKLIPGLAKDQAMTVLSIAAAVICLVLVILFFKTHLGMCIRAVGDNEDMVRASSINTDACKILAFCLSNGLIALSGGLIAQYQGYADISSSTGILVVGLASVIIGEAIFGRRLAGRPMCRKHMRLHRDLPLLKRGDRPLHHRKVTVAPKNYRHLFHSSFLAFPNKNSPRIYSAG